ncbi:cation channel sperm-associated auxiliary subunit TMEM262 [Hemicordylus capensis]|uniref:cation channel sperm-associated auxiliary subunit TMEM262 n=1 Tax=Hemicordylus capensis TaxID=884348 RepID=UPI00230491A3|nr:cation channel sperm-associated auxiliary subunit TMEM262 [Hemicordylus capensis]
MEPSPPAFLLTQFQTAANRQMAAMRSWKDPFVTFTFPKKVIFIILSILFLLTLGAFLSNDLFHFFFSQNGDLMSFRFTIVLLFSHVTSFYWALLATIYTLQADDNVLVWVALTSLACNFISFLIRFCLDFLTISYRKEEYK